MRLTVDQKADALYLRLDEEAIVDSEEIKPGVVLDFNKAGSVVGVEFLDLSKRVDSKKLKNLQFETS
jgi:uncharacterized protein YuzE